MGFVLLTNDATSNKVVNEYRKSWPPEVMFNNSLGAKASEVTREGGRMDGVEQRGLSGGWYIHSSLIV